MLEPRFREGQLLTHFGTHLLDIFREVTVNAHLTNRLGFSLQFFCNAVCLLQEHQCTKNHVI